MNLKLGAVAPSSHRRGLRVCIWDPRGGPSGSRWDLKPDLDTTAWRKVSELGRMTEKGFSPKSGSALSDVHLGENSRDTMFYAMENRILQTEWRRGWDSNPRYGSPYARFRGEYFQPLSHLSVAVSLSILAEPLKDGNPAGPS